MENKSFRINVNVGHSPGGVTLMSLELLQPAGALPTGRPVGRTGRYRRRPWTRNKSLLKKWFFGQMFMLSCPDEMQGCRPGSGEVTGVPWHPQILADQLTLSQPGGEGYDHQIILAPPNFQTFLRPWNGFLFYIFDSWVILIFVYFIFASPLINLLKSKVGCLHCN